MLRAALKGLEPHVKGAVMMGAAHEMAKLKGKVGKHKGKRAGLAFQGRNCHARILTSGGTACVSTVAC